MRKTSILTTSLVIVSFFAAVSARATLLFQDTLNYPNGCIETDGLWYAYSPTVPHHDALVTNDLLILNQNNYDAVAAPTNNFDISNSPPGNTLVFASFTINVSTLPSTAGGYFSSFKDTTNHYVANVFIAKTTNTIVPGTYRLGIANGATSSSANGVAFFPLDLATGLTYQVVYSYDKINSDTYAGATLWVNPLTIDDNNVYGTDSITNPALQTIAISQVGFSQYANQGVAAIGNVMVGTAFSDVQTNTVQPPVIGTGPQTTNIYSGNNLVFYTAASGLGQLSYQWLSNNVPLSDSGTVVGSQSNEVSLLNLQTTANYSVSVANSAGSSTSAVAVVTVNTTPTPAFFTKEPTGATNTYGSTITLSAVANGTGPMNYQWYFEPVGGGSFTPLGSLTNSGTLPLTSVTFAQSGSYYVAATGGYGGATNSTTNTVLVVPPSLVPISFLHSLLSNAPPSTGWYPAGTTQFTVQGVVTSFGEVASYKYCEFFIQDATGGALVYVGGVGNSNEPPVGTLLQVTGEAQQYYGELEVVPASLTNVVVISSNNPLPAPALLNLPLMATNPMSAYGLGLQWSLVTLTNVYLYSSSSGAPVSGNFPTNAYQALYAFQQLYSAGQPYMEIYIVLYTNVLNNINASFEGKPIPSFVRQITAPLAMYSTTQPELDPSRYVDFVTNAPAAAPFNVGVTNLGSGVVCLSWPATNSEGTTYSVYSASSLSGPWTQTFGLGYYPRFNPTGTYTVTNTAAAQFYRVSVP